MYNIIKLAENGITAKRKLGSGRKAKKSGYQSLKVQKGYWPYSDKFSQQQKVSPILIKVMSANYQIRMEFYLRKKMTFQQGLNSKKTFTQKSRNFMNLR